MSLNDILNTARDALGAQQFGLGVTGQNVANVNTPGYARRSAILATQGIAGQSYGSVQVLGVQQASDQFTDRACSIWRVFRARTTWHLPCTGIRDLVAYWSHRDDTGNV